MSQLVNPYDAPQPAAGLDSDEHVVLQKLRDLGLQWNPAVDYQLATLFPKLSGIGHKGDIKARHKMLTKLEPFLQGALADGEQVQYVGVGTQNKFVEQYFMGAVFAALINKTQFVLTNLRILMVHVDARGNPRFPIWAVFYNQIATFKKKLLGEMHLTLSDGSKYKYGGFKGPDRKQMPLLVEQSRQAYAEMGFQPQVTQPRENLCSNCFQVVPVGQLECAPCGQKFWKPTELAIRSFIFPSWGDFLLKHYLIASLELFGYALSWLFYIALIAGGVRDGGVGVAVLVVLSLLIVQHSFDAAMTYFIAKKGLSPKGSGG